MLEAFLIVFGETVVCRLDNSCLFSSAQVQQQAPAAQVQTVTVKPELEIPKEISVPASVNSSVEPKENESK